MNKISRVKKSKEMFGMVPPVLFRKAVECLEQMTSHGRLFGLPFNIFYLGLNLDRCIGSKFFTQIPVYFGA